MLDDSRKMGKGEPLHIILGKKFKLEVWEVILQKMALNEVAQFTVDKSVRFSLVCGFELLSPKDELPDCSSSWSIHLYRKLYETCIDQKRK